MLSWLRNGLRRLSQLQRVFLTTSITHVVLLCMLFFWYQHDTVLTLTLSASARKQGTVVFLPFQKRVGALAHGVGGKGTGHGGKAARLAQATAQRKAPVVHKEEKELAKPTIQTTIDTQSSTVTKSAQKAKKNDGGKKGNKKKKDKRSKKSSRKERKKKEEKKKKQPVKKEAPKKVEEKKPEVEKKPEPVRPPEPPVVPQPEKVEEPKMPEGPLELAISGEDGQVTYIGQEEYDAMMVQDQIHQELERYWQPPVGLEGHACTIRVALDWEGNIKQAHIDASSGILAFDVNARSAVLAMAFPKPTWGKELVLHFKQ